MNIETKRSIIEALEAYMIEQTLSQSEIAQRSGVNASYLIEMRKGKTTLIRAGKEIQIADKYFKRIADLIGFQTEKQYWSTQPTSQFTEILATLQDAKNNGEVAVIIGETGCGKTYTLDLFKKKFSSEVYSIKVGSSDNLADIVDKMMTELRMEGIRKTKSSKLRQIAKHMKQLSEDGLDPVFAFDEAEYMKQPALCSFKELFDYLNEWCSLVLIGTSQLTQNIEKMCKKNKAGIPQLYRRIKFKIRNLQSIDRRYNEFLKNVDPGVQKWLRDNCDNYGELHDVLVPVMRESERTGDELTVDFIKMVLGLK